MNQILSPMMYLIVEIVLGMIIEKIIESVVGKINSSLLLPAIYLLIYRIVHIFVGKVSSLLLPAIYSQMDRILDIVWGKIIEKAIDKNSNVISKGRAEKARLQSVKLELQKLNNTRESIFALLSDAEERRYIEDDSVHRWLRELKAVAFDTEDVYDEFQTYKMLSKTPIDSRGKCWREFDGRDFADRIQKIREEYERVLKERNDLRLQRGEAMRRFNPQRGQINRQEGSFQDPERFHGRQEEKEKILDELLNLRCSDNVQVIFIVGLGGSGKTSLARNIFQYAGLKQGIKYGCSKNHFDLRIWVSLSQNFDLVRTIKEVIKAAERRECHDSPLDLLQYHLKNIITRKRFLLVLDNMWEGRLDFWENLLTPLMDGAEGSKVLVTTQYENFASSTQSVHKLRGLPEEDGWLLLEDLVFSNDKKTVNAFKVPPELEVIGKHIVKECQGFPIAIKAISRLLYFERDEKQWELLSKQLMENENVADLTIPIVRTSYDHLPLHLKHCFAFCSTFPKDYEFGKEELVKLWIALDLIETSTRIQIEDVGERYFDDLFWRSFFQACDSNMKDRCKYKIPTVIHEVAHHLFKYESLRINQDVTEYGESGTARYGLVYQHDKQSVTFNKMFENKGLRALVLCGRNGVLMKEVLIDLFKKLRFLRLLDLSSSCLEELPDSVCNLILLRYLSLHGTNIKKLPDTVSNLYSLQTLELGNCHQIQELPDSIGDLKCLRHLGLHNTNVRRLPETVSNLLNLQTLELGNCYKLEMLPRSLRKLVHLRYLGLQLDWDSWDRQFDIISMPPGIRCLTSLRHLSRFAVGSDPQCGIGELKDLKELRGKLCITKLEKVVSVNDAEAANLSSKRHIDSLMLRWSDAAYTELENVLEDVIDRLQPHKDLQNLYVENYNGKEFPNWMRDPSFLKLETLKLMNCRTCSSLPCVWKLPSLKTLQIKGLHGVTRFGSVHSGFENLETLNVSEMHNLESWFLGAVQMSCLTALYISDCPNLKNLSDLPPSVKTFELRNCPKLELFDILPNLKDLVLEGDSRSRRIWIQHLISLTSLTLSKLSGLQFNHKRIFKYLTSLKQLKVQDCDDLESIDFTNDSSLEYLEISCCPKLSKIGLPEKLKKFCLRSCPSLTSLPHKLHLLSSLRVIEIHSVSLAAMARLPAKVEKLVIKECSVLSKRCQSNGADWPNIQHIPYIQVDQNEYGHGISPSQMVARVQIIEEAVGIISDYFSKWKAEKARLQSVGWELQKLNILGTRILALLNDAEKRRYIYDDSVSSWLHELNEVATYTAHAYDEFETCKIHWREFNHMDFADRIQMIREKYQRIVRDLGLQIGDAVKNINHPVQFKREHFDELDVTIF